MSPEGKKRMRKRVDFAMALIRTLAAIVSVLFNLYIFYKLRIRP